MLILSIDDWAALPISKWHVYYDILNNELMVDCKVKAPLFVDLHDNALYIYIGEL